jgi:tRNA (cmo5U34)-methyltransferase
MPAYEEMHDLARHLLRSLLGERARVLVVGSGTGAELMNLGRHNPGWRLVGVDPSPDMVEVSARRVAESGIGGRVELRTGLVQDLPLAPPYDAATAMLVMHFLPDDGQKLGFLRDISARLEPGAPFVLADLHGDRESGVFARFIEAWRLRQRETAMAEDAASAMLDDFATKLQVVPRERMVELLHEAGFKRAEPFYTALLVGAWISFKSSRTP